MKILFYSALVVLIIISIIAVKSLPVMCYDDSPIKQFIVDEIYGVR